MPKRKVPLSQIEIPVPSSPNAKAFMAEEDKAAEYARAVGNEAAERQRLAYIEATRCTCGIDERYAKQMAIRYHKAGCHKIPLKVRAA